MIVQMVHRCLLLVHRYLITIQLVHRCLLLVHRYLITIQLPDFLFTIQVPIQLMDHLAIRHNFTIQILDVSGNLMPTVSRFRNKIKKFIHMHQNELLPPRLVKRRPFSNKCKLGYTV